VDTLITIEARQAGISPFRVISSCGVDMRRGINSKVAGWFFCGFLAMTVCTRGQYYLPNDSALLHMDIRAVALIAKEP
jgi:hypothetical protein